VKTEVCSLYSRAGGGKGKIRAPSLKTKEKKNSPIKRKVGKGVFCLYIKFLLEEKREGTLILTGGEVAWGEEVINSLEGNVKT